MNSQSPIVPRARAGDARSHRKRIAIINSIVELRDAVSANVRDHALLLDSLGYQVTVFSYKCDYPELNCIVVTDINQLIFHEYYCNADLIIWHFGIYYEIFNAALIGNGHAPRVVCFHNVTPPQFAPESNRHTIERSFQQAHLMAGVEEVWAVSRINAEVARELGTSPDIIHDMPLIVNAPRLARLQDKSLHRIEVLYVGRFTQAKGVADLLEAIHALSDKQKNAIHLTLSGNVEFSDPAYVKALERSILKLGLSAIVDFVASPTDRELFALYRRAHLLAIPSYHEGFCKPVIESLRSGSIPVGYASYNLPFITNGLGRMVEPGNIAALSAAIGELVAALSNPRKAGKPSLPLDRGPTSQYDFDNLSKTYVKTFESRQIKTLMGQRVNALIDSPDRK